MADAIRLLLAPFLWRCGSGLRRIFLYSLSKNHFLELWNNHSVVLSAGPALPASSA
jgi:hypothetical protein